VKFPSKVCGARGGRAAPNYIFLLIPEFPFNGAALLFWDYIPEQAGAGKPPKNKMKMIY